MSWEKEISELDLRNDLAEKMGGEEKVARQHEFGKLTIRERVDKIVDSDSFHEIGKLAGVGEYDKNGELKDFTPSNFIFGTAEIDGKPVIVSGDDFTVRGGSADASIAGKRLQAEGLALEAADVALEYGLAMADAMIYATASRHEAEIVTGDADFDGLPRVTLIR